MPRICLHSLIVLWILTGCCTPKSGSDAEVRWKSPSGAYLAVFAVSETSEGSESRSLVIKSCSDSHVLFSMAVERFVRVAWAGDDLCAAVVDDYGSSENRVILVGLPRGERLAEVTADSLQGIYPGLPSRDYSHVYFDRVKWTAPRRFEAEVFMYDPLSDRVPPRCSARIELKYPGYQRSPNPEPR